ncbi:MAG: DUF4160 domain-containing protein [Deltaproteobacteria bacterium]|jgi:hypothetical protein|nr:DUF4160 domain-containing protein [Deltaproteobacteria bacterium]
MPKLYEYFGILILFHSNEHEPIHVHGLYHGKKSKAEIIVKNGKVIEVKIVETKSRPLDGAQLKDFEKLVNHYADEIVQSWIDYFVLHKKIYPKKITRRIK